MKNKRVDAMYWIFFGAILPERMDKVAFTHNLFESLIGHRSFPSYYCDKQNQRVGGGQFQ